MNCLFVGEPLPGMGPKSNGSSIVPSAKVCQPAGCSCSTWIFLRTTGGHKTCVRESERVLRRTPGPLLAIPVEAAVAPRLSASQE
jgi:hypothetical protein